MMILIENAEVYTPDPVGRTSVLLTGSTIGKVGRVEARALESLGVDHEIVDGSGCLVVPGFIDPHQHLLGGSGEKGFSSQTPEFFLSEIVRWGITSVVGVLGVDTTMKTMPGLLAKAKALKEEGLNAYLWSGGYNIPPTTIMSTVRDDILFIDEVIGAGEIAISDLRGMHLPPHEVARVLTDCYVGGMLAGKAGRTHFHVGDAPTRLQPLRDLLEGFNIEPSWMYATHVGRSEALMREAIELAERGAAVDIDTVERDLPRWLRFYFENDGARDRLTVSSDAGINSPRVLFEQVRACVQEQGFPLEEILPVVTRNTARVLGLPQKGGLVQGRDADIVVLEKDSLEIVHVLSLGRWMVRNGELVVRERFLEDSQREIHMRGRRR